MNKMTINPNIISFKNKIMPTKNVAQASIWTDESYKKSRNGWSTVAVASAAVAYFTYADSTMQTLNYTAVVIAVISLIVTFWCRPSYELHLRTNGGDINFLRSNNKKFMQEILSAITSAISGTTGNIEYHVNVDAKTITEGARISVTGSSNVNLVGGNASNSTFNASTNGLALQGINDLMLELSKISGPQTTDARALLEEIRSQLAKGSSGKQQAIEKWTKFVSSLGAITGITVDFWSIVAKVGNAIHS